MVSFADKPRSEDFDISSHRRRISVAEDILRSPDEDSISVASAFSQRSDCEDDIEVNYCYYYYYFIFQYMFIYSYAVLESALQIRKYDICPIVMNSITFPINFTSSVDP